MSKASETTQFKVGNRFWEARSSHGRSPLFETPDQLWEACLEYFEWVADNPMKAVELVKHQGIGIQHEVPLMRNMSEDGLKIFLDISNQTWANYKSKPDFLEITEKVVAVIRTHKMDGAVTGMFKESIIARELGLADKQDVQVKGQLQVAGDILYKKPNGSQ